MIWLGTSTSTLMMMLWMGTIGPFWRQTQWGSSNLMKVVRCIPWPSKILFASGWRSITHPLVSPSGRRLSLLNNIAYERRIPNWWDWTITWSPNSFASWLLPICRWFSRSCPNHMFSHSPLQVTVPPNYKSSYFDIHIWVGVNGVFHNLHLVIILFYGCHIAINILALIVKILDVLFPMWRNKLISVNSDDKNTMTSYHGGLVLCC